MFIIINTRFTQILKNKYKDNLVTVMASVKFSVSSKFYAVLYNNTYYIDNVIWHIRALEYNKR